MLLFIHFEGHREGSHLMRYNRLITAVNLPDVCLKSDTSSTTSATAVVYSIPFAMTERGRLYIQQLAEAVAATAVTVDHHAPYLHGRIVEKHAGVVGSYREAVAGTGPQSYQPSGSCGTCSSSSHPAFSLSSPLTLPLGLSAAAI